MRKPSRQVLTLQAGDVLLLACDGLHGQVSDDVIRERLSAEDAAERLVRLAELEEQRRRQAGRHPLR